jgi:hypothetical protein
VLTDELQINKAKAKALIGNAKDVCPGVLFWWYYATVRGSYQRLHC